MKEVFEKAQVEVIEFNNEDVIVTSIDTNNMGAEDADGDFE